MNRRKPTKAGETNVITTTEQKNSLITKYIIEKLNEQGTKMKVIFTVLNGVELVYYTNSAKFIESLEAVAKELDNRFIIHYYPSDDKKLTENRILRVKLPKVKKA